MSHTNNTSVSSLSDDELIARVQLAGTVVGLTPTSYNTSANDVNTMLSGLASLVTASQQQQLKIEAAKAATASKNAARATVETQYRNISNGAHADPACTNIQLVAAGFQPRATGRSPVPPPSVKPIVVVEGSERQALQVRILYPDHPKGGKPANVANTAVFYHVGPAAPANLKDYAWAGNFGKTRFEIPFDPADAGKTVWLVAVPLNQKGDKGPMSEGVSGIIAA